MNLILILVISNVQAKKVPGYIVTNKADTIFGLVKIPRFNLNTGGLVFYGIDLESFHHKVVFKESGAYSFSKYKPGEISAFGFENDSTNYKFNSFLIKSRSIVKQDSETVRFLNLIFQGEVAIYKEIIRRPDPDYLDSNQLSKNDRIYYDYYLYNEKHGLHKVTRTKEYESLTELLTLYEIDNSYLERLSTDIRFKDIKELLSDYEKWKVL